MHPRFITWALGIFAISSVVLASATSVRASTAGPITLFVDASSVATQNVLFVHERIPVTAGPLTLYYPEWIPGEHGPAGPIANVAGVVVKAGGAVLPWQRDPYDLYAFKVTVPTSVDHIDVDMTYLGATFGIYSSNRLASANIAAIVWTQALLYPSTGTIADTIFRTSIKLPGSDWKFATALTGSKRDGDVVSFDDTSLERLADSPLDMGVNFRRWKIWSDGDAAAYLDVFGDIPEEVNASDEVVAHYGALVREMLAMYGVRHWRNYNFLLTVSDVLPGEGIEHHESSDDGAGGDYLINDDSLKGNASLLSHEFNHSWDGKYRMPEGLYPSNLQKPYDDSLLWIYEGMTQYYGDIMSWRDGLRDAKTWPDFVASRFATFDNEPGREWRSLGDTAVSGPFLYGAPAGYTSERRRIDFYSEGALMWLKADSIIRAQSNDTKSLDTFARAFFGGSSNTGPIVKTYNRQDVIEGLNAIAPYDWAGFFTTWIDQVAPHPPDGFTADGWKLVYTDQPQTYVEKSNFFYSLGLALRGDTIGDVRFGSAAWKAGLGLATRIVAVNGRAFSSNALYDAIKAAHVSHQPLQLLVSRTDAYREVEVSYDEGNRYPHLVRIEGTPDRLSEVIKPLAPPLAKT